MEGRQVVATLDDLVQELYQVFEDDHVNVEVVQDLLASYKSNPIEWKKFAKFDRYRYTRNLIDEGNGKFNLMLLCWGPSHTSTIHDHANAHCFMKMMSGSLQEVRFEWPQEAAEEQKEQEMVETDRNVLKINDVVYINDSLGLHRVENTSHSEGAVSLHLYCPPFSSCSIFDERTGKKMKCPVTFWSKYGQKVEQKKSKTGC
ncbi:cysteine dioxygenase type 1 [Procambarus clarkii]|uniref:cysteine dioxygenase type 1 n=1 Tax=Procambarus clarkii TaxID=6728 RepID=UPI001E6747A3|nr:cysteine dioxygenase type 1-like isoform X2 [Procambarus clarkii]